MSVKKQHNKSMNRKSKQKIERLIDQYLLGFCLISFSNFTFGSHAKCSGEQLLTTIEFQSLGPFCLIVGPWKFDFHIKLAYLPSIGSFAFQANLISVGKLLAGSSFTVTLLLKIQIETSSS